MNHTDLIIAHPPCGCLPQVATLPRVILIDDLPPCPLPDLASAPLTLCYPPCQHHAHPNRFVQQALNEAAAKRARKAARKQQRPHDLA